MNESKQNIKIYVIYELKLINTCNYEIEK